LLKLVRGMFRQAWLIYGLGFHLGQDATEAFEDVGHSDEARALLPDMFIGDFEQSSVSAKKPCLPRRLG